MKSVRNCLFTLTLFLGFSVNARGQDIVPDGPFKTVHLVIVTPVQAAFLVSAVKDFNREFAQQGCSGCIYRVFKMVAGKENKYNYMVTADWPSSDAYVKIHQSREFAVENKKSPIMSDLSATEFYGRYIEVK